MNKPKTAPLRVSIVIPVYNNEKTIQSELTNIIRLLRTSDYEYEILVADDNSSDGSLSIVDALARRTSKIRIIKNKTNLGIASNIQQLYKKARNEYVLLYSADGDWNYRDIKKLLSTAEKKGLDLVVGKRLSKKGYSMTRRVISFSYNLLPRILFSVDTEDAGSIKVFKKALIRNQQIAATSIFYESELIIRSKRNKYRIGSVKVHYRRQQTKTKNSISLQHVALALKDLMYLKRSL